MAFRHYCHCQCWNSYYAALYQPSRVLSSSGDMTAVTSYEASLVKLRPHKALILHSIAVLQHTNIEEPVCILS